MTWIIRRFLPIAYDHCYQMMQQYAPILSSLPYSELWLVEHFPVYTVGLSCHHKRYPPLPHPLVQTDRGGQITYHGPGQIVVYVLSAIRQNGIAARCLVHALEEAIIHCLNHWHIPAERESGKPGIYVGKRKIASIGLRIRRGISYHGLALNTCMDVSPFEAIDPCGYPGLLMTQVADYMPAIRLTDVQEALLYHMQATLSEVLPSFSCA